MTTLVVIVDLVTFYLLLAGLIYVPPAPGNGVPRNGLTDRSRTGRRGHASINCGQTMPRMQNVPYSGRLGLSPCTGS